MAVVYTHTFEIEAGGKTIHGEIEFNEDGTVSYKTDNPISNLTLEQAGKFNEMFKCCKDIYDTFGGVTKIEIVKK